MPHNKCPICLKPADVKCLPFCSLRCADIDLGRWLNQTYTVPVAEVDSVDIEVSVDNDTHKKADP